MLIKRTPLLSNLIDLQQTKNGALENIIPKAKESTLHKIAIKEE